MTPPADPPIAAHGALAFGRKALQQLRVTLERDLGSHGATSLQHVGFAAGEAAHTAFCAWLAERHGVADPGDLDAAEWPALLSAFFEAEGWGPIAVTRVHPALLALDSANWAEADPAAPSEYPACYLSCGLFADLLGRLAGAPMAVLEVECRSHGDARCRFLAGSPETLAALYERLATGVSYHAALASANG